MTALEIIGRLVLAAVCSGLVGFEREVTQKSAGLRTHTLVGVGAAMFSVVSIIGFEGPDESRVAAQIVTGVGFLGAGAIWREGGSVKGLTTAAGLWSVAAIGVAAGSGAWHLAAIGTGVTLAILYGLYAVDQAIARRTRRESDRLEVHLDDVSKLTALVKFAQKLDAGAQQLAFRRTGEKSGVLIVAVNPDLTPMVSEMLMAHKGVAKVEKLSPLYWGLSGPMQKR